MWKQLKLYFLKKLYRVLVVKVYTLDRSVLSAYQKFHTFCNYSFQTNQGCFNFSFKEDRRAKVRDKSRFNRSVTSYLVEFEGTPVSGDTVSPLYSKVIVVVLINIRRVNYEALAKVLLELYIDQVPGHPRKPPG